jgi:hypothetical protein
MHTKVLRLLLAGAALAVCGVVHADVRLLGSTRLAQAENDVDVVSVACKPRVNALQVEAERGAAEIERLWVRYGNGDVDTLAVRDRLAEGTRTRWIDLEGGRRCVVAVGVVGDTEGSVDRTRLKIWGRTGR